MDAALRAACAEFGPRLAEDTLREAGAPDAWSYPDLRLCLGGYHSQASLDTAACGGER
jgi:hypothetical protein